MIDRRMLMLAIGGLMAEPTITLADLSGSAEDTIPLWPSVPPGGGGPSGPVVTGQKGAISNISAPALEVYRPERPSGAAMLIAAGGGYKRIEVATEALPAAGWLIERGITAFVLHYRLPGEGWNDGAVAPVQDAQRALRVIRNRGGIDPTRVGVLGFSAGGHLMGLATTRSAWTSYPAVDATDSASARPDEAALIYPVVTLEPPYDRTSTRLQLVGRHPDPEERAEWSVQPQVHNNCPSMFLVQAEDDPISNIANTAILEQACRRAGVPVERHVLPSGGHGFGMGRPGTPTAEWPTWYQAWLRARRILT